MRKVKAMFGKTSNGAVWGKSTSTYLLLTGTVPIKIWRGGEICAKLSEPSSNE